MPAHIVLIEDDDQLRDAIVRYLLGHRHRVTICGSIAEASGALEGLPVALAPDVVMSGAFLANGDSVRFFRKASARFPEMRWILTATSSAPDERVIDDLPSDGSTARRETGIRANRRRIAR